MRCTTLSQFAIMLGKFFDRYVLDYTGLTGTFDIELQGKYENLSLYDNPNLNAALRNQLGLALIRKR